MALMQGTEIVFQFLREYVRIHNQQVLAVSSTAQTYTLYSLKAMIYLRPDEQHHSRRRLGGGD